MTIWKQSCKFSRTAALGALVASTWSCSSDDPDEPTPPIGSAGDALVGTFQMQLTPNATTGSGSTSVLGKVYDGPTPSALAWEETARSGSCVLNRPVVPFCDPGCGSDVCVADGSCRPYPTVLDAGAVRLVGMQTASGVSDVTLIQVAGAYQAPGSAMLAFPPFAEGAAVRVEAAGADLAAFSLEATGIAPLTVTSSELTLASGEPLLLAWEPAADPSSSRLEVELDISHHGGTKGVIECDTADSGSLNIDASLVDQLVALGVAGFPAVTLARRSVGSTLTSAGRVDLALVSDAKVLVTVPGVVSCTENSECPSGTCRPDLTCS